MTMITTLLAPIFLVPAFQKGGSGLRKSDGGADADAGGGSKPTA